MAHVSLKITLTGTIDEATIDAHAGLGGDLINYINSSITDGSVVINSADADYDQAPIDPAP